jgi:DNA-binding NarL/FixJ family response regulator
MPLRLIVLRPFTSAFKPLPGPEEVNLAPRQQEILRLLAMGRTDQEIADALHIGLTTVKHHNQEIFTKLQVTTRAAAAVWAWKKLDSFTSLEIV